MTNPQDAPLGRRETRKRATRRALQDAANRLFQETGYAGTTVRDIADAAGVTERTFFRYFSSKEELLAERVLASLPALIAVISDRPAGEPPLVAVQQAFTQLIDVASVRDESPTVRDFFAQGPPGVGIRGGGAGVLLSFEQGIAQALRPRLARADPALSQHVLDYRCEVLAAAAMSVIRSALLRDSRRNTDNHGEPRHLQELITDGFAVLHTLPGSDHPSGP